MTKFEEWLKSKETEPTSIAGILYLEAWLAGRESMRDEAIDKLGDFEALKCAQIVAGIEP